MSEAGELSLKEKITFILWAFFGAISLNVVLISALQPRVFSLVLVGYIGCLVWVASGVIWVWR